MVEISIYQDVLRSLFRKFLKIMEYFRIVSKRYNPHFRFWSQMNIIKILSISL